MEMGDVGTGKLSITLKVMEKLSMRTTHKVKQYAGNKPKGGGKMPAVPTDYLPSGSAGNPTVKPEAKGLNGHSTRQSHGTKQMNGGY